MRPPVTPAQRRRIIAAIGMTVVGLILLVFGFISLTSTDDPPSAASQETLATAATTTTVTTTMTAVSTTPPSTSSSVGSPAPVVLPVTVLNASPDLTPGLATRVADTLAAAGWPIADVQNYDASQIAVTTVYFTPGNAAEETAAQTLVTQFPEIAGGAQPRFPDLGGSGLTVAAVGDWLP